MKQDRGTMHLFLVVVALVLPSTLVASSSQSPYITIPALGRIAHFGYLYNEQTGEIRSSSVFRTSNLPNISILTTELHSTFTDAAVTNTFAEKLQLLNIDANTGANILSGLVKVKGSARILKDQQAIDEELTGILHYQHQTVDQDLQMFADALKELYNSDLLNHREATHFVSGITWGLNAAVAFKGIATQHKSKTDVRHELVEEFDALRENSQEVDNSKTNFSMLVYSDVALPNGQKPTNLRELQEIQNQIPQAIRSTNDGKGIPIQYKLTPISAIRNYLNVPDRFNVFARDISDLTLGKFFPIFDEISSTEQQLKTVREKLGSNLNCVHQDTRDQINELNLNVTEFKKTFQETFQASLLSVRAGNVTSSELIVLAKSFRLTDFLGTKMRRTLAEFKNALDKIDFCNNLRNLNLEIEYFGAVDDLRSKIFQNRNKTIFGFFYKSEFIQNDAAIFDNHLNIFLSYIDSLNSKLFVVDCDFNFPSCESVSNTTIKQFDHGIITSSDFVQETKAQENKFEEQIRQLNENFRAAHKIMNTTVDEIQNNLRDINAHNKIVNTSIAVLEENLGEVNKTVKEFRKNLDILETQDAALNSSCLANREEIQNLHNEINTMNQDNCNPNKCENNGTCVNGFKSFTCHCPPNYTGQLCQDVDECMQTPNLCQNGGTCTNSNGSYSCDCTSEWTGAHCETDVDDCLNVTCLNGGTCRDRVGGHFCECLPEFEGQTCSQRSSIECRRLLANSRISVQRQNSRLVTLNCGGLVSLPPQGSSILLEYKSNETYNNNKRCLWTLDSLHRNSGRKYWRMELKVTMLCDGFGNSRDVLTLHALTHKEQGKNDYANFSSHHLQSNKSVEMLLSGSYLSFTSDQSTTGYGFVVEIEVVRLYAGKNDFQYKGQNYFYFGSQGTFTHGPYTRDEQVSIAINSLASTTLTVISVDTEKCSTSCDCDALNIFEIQENGVLFEKGRLCGTSNTSPLTFTTADPILAVFTSDQSHQGRGFQMSWN